MLSAIAGVLLAGVLVVSAVAKLARPRQSIAAMRSFGFRTLLARRLAWTFAVVAEIVLAVGVAAGDDRAAYAAAGLMLLFALTLGSALTQGRAGQPCACFGGGSTVSAWAIGRDVALAAAFAALPSIPDSLSAEGWLATGLVFALLLIVDRVRRRNLRSSRAVVSATSSGRIPGDGSLGQPGSL